MKILQTSDFNFGKRFFNRDRFSEVKAVLSELVNIANDKKPDAVLIAGNVFYSAPASSKYVELLGDALSKLSAGGKRAVILIGGKNDDAEELKALVHFADKQGITVVADAHSVPIRTNPSFLTRVTAAGRGYVEITDEKGETALISLVPHIGASDLAALKGESAEERVAEILNGAKSGAKIKIALLSLGFSDISDEREDGKLSKAVFEDYDYIALGGAESGRDGKFFASGAPVDYDFSETCPSAVLVELDADGVKDAEVAPLSSARTLKNVIVSDFDSAREELKAYKDCYTRLLVSSDKPVSREKSSALREEYPLLADIVFGGAAAEYVPAKFKRPCDGGAFAKYLEKYGAPAELAEIFKAITEERQ
jgi:DNA repair exonuclease SbcCD nuclease subunit